VKVIYAIPPGRGWNLVTHMVRLMAELFSAELVTYKYDRKWNTVQEAMSLARRRRGSETCLVVASSPRTLLGFVRSEYWLKGYGQLAAWVIDSFWLERIPFALKHRPHFDQLFVTGGEDVEPWAAALDRPVSWLPWGADVLRLGSENPDRPVDLQRIGRQPAEWDDDAGTERACSEIGLRFEGRPPMLADATANQKLLMGRSSKAKFVLAFSNAVNRTSYTHPTRVYITGRWLDAIATGAVIAGVAPDCVATRELLWPESTLELGTVERSAGLERIAEAVSTWSPELARINHREALARLDWRWRFAELAEALDIESAPLASELDTLRQLLGERAPAAS
jgi:hypothetical protein